MFLILKFSESSVEFILFIQNASYKRLLISCILSGFFSFGFETKLIFCLICVLIIERYAFVFWQLDSNNKLSPASSCCLWVFKSVISYQIMTKAWKESNSKANSYLTFHKASKKEKKTWRRHNWWRKPTVFSCLVTHYLIYGILFGCYLTVLPFSHSCRTLKKKDMSLYICPNP